MEQVVLDTNLRSLPLYKKGKVRDIYSLDDRLLIVATDRISAFDSVLQVGIPEKGKILNALSAFWFGYTREIISNHALPLEMPHLSQKEDKLVAGRSMLVKKAKPFPVECIVRGYLTGSAWKKYQNGDDVGAYRLPPGLPESAKLPEPIFTPSTKAEAGHDVDISFNELQNILGAELAIKLRRLSIDLYVKAATYAEPKGIFIADTKFEFGTYEGEVILIDEALTPDSSRFWAREKYKPGNAQPSFDKQFVRDYLETTGWDKNPPAPMLPDEVIKETSRKYLEAYHRLLGPSADLPSN